MTVFCPRNLFCYDYTSLLMPGTANSAGRRGVCCPLDLAMRGGRYDDYYQPQQPMQPMPWVQNPAGQSQGTLRVWPQTSVAQSAG